jgi:hypothetical protein
MSYITKTNPDEMTFGTSLQGYITATYAELVELFCGPDAPPVEAITSWNIGGNTPEAAEKVLELSSHYRLNGDRRTRMARQFKKLDRIQESLDRALANKE